MTQTAERLDDVVDLSGLEDLAPPCEAADSHPKHGTGPATWVLTLRLPYPCGCMWPTAHWLICDGCWDYLRSSDMVNRIDCGQCHQTFPLSTLIAKVERL